MSTTLTWKYLHLWKYIHNFYISLFSLHNFLKQIILCFNIRIRYFKKKKKVGHLATKAFFSGVDRHQQKKKAQRRKWLKISVSVASYLMDICILHVYSLFLLPPSGQKSTTSTSTLLLVFKVNICFPCNSNALSPSKQECSSLIQSFHLYITNRHISLANSPVLLVQSSPGRFPSSSSCGFAQSIPCIKQERILFIKEKTELKYEKRF